jgi:hypothetical protein
MYGVSGGANSDRPLQITNVYLYRSFAGENTYNWKFNTAWRFDTVLTYQKITVVLRPC